MANQRNLIELTKARIESFDAFMEPRYRLMREWFDLYQGTYFAERGSLEADLFYDVKLIYSIINGFVPSLILSDPDIVLRPRKETSVNITQLTEVVSNYYWRELNIKEELKKVVRDTFIYGFGVMKTGWNTKFRSRNKKFDSESPGGEKNFDVSEYLQTDSPFMHRVSPYFFMWDPQARTLDSARWVGEKLIRPIEEVINNKAYDQKIAKDINPSTYGMQDVLFGDDGAHVIEQDPDKYAVLYEIHDRERNLLITLADGVEEPLRVIPYPYKDLEGTHYGMLVYHPLPDRVEGLSLVELLRDQQITLNRVRTLQANHAKKCARIYAVSTESAMKNEDIEKIQRGVDGAVVRVNGRPEDIKALDHAVLPQELFAMGDISRGDMMMVAGSPPHRFGMPAGGRTSATEIQSMNTAEQFRLEDMRTVTEDFSGRMTKKMIQIMANKLSDEKVIMIAGEDKFQPFKFRKEDLKGEFDFTVEAGSMVRQNREVERQQLIQFLNMTAQLPQVNHLEIVKRIAKTFGWKNLSNLIQQQAPVEPQGILSTQVQNTPNPPSATSQLTSPFTNEGK